MNKISLKLTQLYNTLENFLFFNKGFNEYFLPLLRIGLGCLILIKLIAIQGNVLDFYGNDSFIPTEISNVLIVEDSFTLPYIYANLPIQEAISEAGFIKMIFNIHIIFLLFFVFGFFTKVSSFITFTLNLVFCLTGHLFSYGVDGFITILLFYSLLANTNNILSIDKQLGIFQGNKFSISNVFILRALQIHLCFIYFFAGTAKAVGINWWNGESIWRSLHIDSVSFNIDFLSNFPLLLTILGISALLLDILYCIFIWISRTRKITLTLTLLMHIFIGVVLGLPLFASVMMLFNLVAFYIPYQRKNQWFEIA